MVSFLGINGSPGFVACSVIRSIVIRQREKMSHLFYGTYDDVKRAVIG